MREPEDIDEDLARWRRATERVVPRAGFADEVAERVMGGAGSLADALGALGRVALAGGLAAALVTGVLAVREARDVTGQLLFLDHAGGMP